MIYDLYNYIIQKQAIIPKTPPTTPNNTTKVLRILYGGLRAKLKVIPYGMINPSVTQQTHPTIERTKAKFGYKNAVN